MCSLILAFSTREEGVIFFFFRSSLLFVLVTLLSTIISAFCVSYFIEQCSFAILVRKKNKTYTREHANMSIYTCCVLLYHSSVLQNTKMIPRQNFSKDKNMRKFKLVYKFSQRLSRVSLSWLDETPTKDKGPVADPDGIKH